MDVQTAYQAALDELARDPGAAPCSRYGRESSEWHDTAALVAVILAAEGDGLPDGLTPELIDGAASLVVNDSDEPAELIRAHGHEYLRALGKLERDFELGPDPLEEERDRLEERVSELEDELEDARAWHADYDTLAAKVADYDRGIIDRDELLAAAGLPHAGEVI